MSPVWGTSCGSCCSADCSARPGIWSCTASTAPIRSALRCSRRCRQPARAWQSRRRKAPQGEALLLVQPGAQEEIRAAAHWARAILEREPDAAVGIVVPDLARSRARIARTFDEVLIPATALAPGAAPARPWNLSLGLPLSQWPVVHAALLLLELASDRLPTTGGQRSVALRLPGRCGSRARDARAARRAHAPGRRAPCHHRSAGLSRPRREPPRRLSAPARAAAPAPRSRPRVARGAAAPERLGPAPAVFAGRGRLARRAHARQRGVPDRRGLARAARRAVAPRPDPWPAGVSDGGRSRAPAGRGTLVSAGDAAGAGPGDGRAGIDRARVRSSAGARPARRGLAAARAPQSAPAGRAAAAGRRARQRPRMGARVRAADDRGMAASGAAGGVLFPGRRRRSHARAQPVARGTAGRGPAAARLGALDRVPHAVAPGRGAREPGGHRRPRAGSGRGFRRGRPPDPGPGCLPVSRLRCPSPRRHGPRRAA